MFRIFFCIFIPPYWILMTWIYIQSRVESWKQKKNLMWTTEIFESKIKFNFPQNIHLSRFPVFYLLTKYFCEGQSFVIIFLIWIWFFFITGQCEACWIHSISSLLSLIAYSTKICDLSWYKWLLEISEEKYPHFQTRWPVGVRKILWYLLRFSKSTHIRYN